ncbi:hypothetical protein CE143_11830 [Photorhabdus luminescens]|uniref:Uncharacterized protein n=1 Tax=Photorhabdus akhurstii TaxID=171438 RepID=A0ABX8LUZ4_9GAMM|nr:aegerolysin family protein [Photorhabdus akhurstii]PQQ28937.1 hypothetical protein C6H64_13585 [Photorhabdus luminescens]QXF33755.1 hypothetical protein B0X70_11830 [Photorhabdus akhurstii]UJD75570.1 hypothetical protein CE143_11830 [Photorhabdus luminescens]
MGAAEKFYLTIRNDSKHKKLIFDQIHFDWGRVSDDSYPVTEVPPQTTIQVLVAQGRENASSGTQGWIRYKVENIPGKWVRVDWDVPWLSGQENTCSPSNSDQNSPDDPNGNIEWEPQTPTSSSGTTLSVLMKFGYVIEA